ncbi:hypothetical protein ISS37_04205 [candidate division KSB1 bacterium]|nr:hypothetical protein [candidate division KSB1 bacterium]
MKKILIMFFILMVFKSQLWAQHYITLGLGFSGAFFDSEDLDRFKETYNSVNSPYLANYMRGIGGAMGLRWEIGYRYIGRLGTAVLIGMQNYKSNDAAQYQNGEVRNLELKMNSMYVESEIGHTRKNFFVNGVLTLFFDRKLTLKSKYSGPTSEAVKNPLNGTYNSDTSISTDMGIAIGIIKEPIILTGKITYPLFTGGGSNILQDKRVEKIENGTDIFPNDYEDYCFDKTYDGVASDIDGLKILVTIALVIPLKK